MKSARQPLGAFVGRTMSNNMKNGVIRKEEDEDELEALRLAALESLRAKGLPPPALPSQSPNNSPSNQVFQRNFSNQNLISIIPVDHSSRSGNALLATPPDFHEKVASSNINMRNSSLSLPGIKPLPPPAEEKPKASSKFSRFDDSDSDESDDYEMSLLKSDSEAEYVEQEEIILEEVEGDENEELIIEVEDYIVLEEANGTDEDHQSIKSTPLKEQPTLPAPPTPIKSPPKKEVERKKSPINNGDVRKESIKPIKSSPLPTLKKSSPPPPPPPPPKAPASSSTRTDSERLESRKRKFETPAVVEKKEGKIRLITAPESSTAVKKEEVVKTKEVIKMKETVKIVPKEKSSQRERNSVDDRKEKKKSRDKEKRKSPIKETVKVKRPNSTEPSNELDLRAELQRRKINRHDEEEAPRSKSKESRRILVIKSPSPPFTSASKSSTSSSQRRSSGVLSKHRRSSPEQILVAKRGGGQSAPNKRTAVLTTSDKGRDKDDPLEDRIRQMRAKNEQIRKRQMEIEADKLQYA